MSGWLSALSRFLCRLKKELLFMKVGQNSLELNVSVSVSQMYVSYIMQGERQVKAEERDGGIREAHTHGLEAKRIFNVSSSRFIA